MFLLTNADLEIEAKVAVLTTRILLQHQSILVRALLVEDSDPSQYLELCDPNIPFELSEDIQKMESNMIRSARYIEALDSIRGLTGYDWAKEFQSAVLRLSESREALRRRCQRKLASVGESQLDVVEVE